MNLIRRFLICNCLQSFNRWIKELRGSYCTQMIKLCFKFYTVLLVLVATQILTDRCPNLQGSNMKSWSDEISTSVLHKSSDLYAVMLLLAFSHRSYENNGTALDRWVHSVCTLTMLRQIWFDICLFFSTRHCCIVIADWWELCPLFLRYCGKIYTYLVKFKRISIKHELMAPPRLYYSDISLGSILMTCSAGYIMWCTFL